MSLQYLHTMIRVGDLDAALDFFCTKLGLIRLTEHRFLLLVQSHEVRLKKQG